MKKEDEFRVNGTNLELGWERVEARRGSGGGCRNSDRVGFGGAGGV